MGVLKIGSIGHGQAIDPNHILDLYKALNGESSNDIIIKGRLEIKGPFSVEGKSFIYGNLNVSGDITGSKLNITGDYVQIGERFIIKNNAVFITGELNIKNSTVFGENLTISGSVILPYLPQNQNSNIFLSIDKETNVVTYSTGSIKDFEIEKFKFRTHSGVINLHEIEDATSFKGKIKNLSVDFTNSIESSEISSRLDTFPTWIKHNNIQSLEKWIDSNVNEDIFWIKIVVKYKPFLAGMAEAILKYSI
jgi:hypothetical protein